VKILTKIVNILQKTLSLLKNFNMANIFNLLGNKITGLMYGGGTDRYTRMLPTGQVNFGQLMTEQKEVYDTINNNEFNLYSTTPQLFIVINKKATMLTNGVFVVKDWKTGKVIENDPVLKLLEKPNPIMNRNEWLMDISINHDIYGNAYIYKNKFSNLTQYPNILMNLPNADMKIVKTGKLYKQTDINEIIEKYVLVSNKEEFTNEEIIHIKTSNQLDPVMGLSPLHAIQMPISNIRGAYGFRNVNITKKGALGIISATGNDAIGAIRLDDSDRLDLEKQFAEETHGIFDRQSPVKFSANPVNYQHLSYPIKDSLLFEEVDANLKAIIDNFQLNENIFSRQNASKFSNLQEGLKMAYGDSIIPFSEKLCFALNEGLKMFEQGKYIEMDFSHLKVFQDNEVEKSTVIKTKSEALAVLLANGYKQADAEIIVGLRS
jgi:hypothetical protein